MVGSTGAAGASGASGSGAAAGASGAAGAAAEGIKRFVLAFDTANEVIAIGLGELSAGGREVLAVASVEVEARRASNTRLLPLIDETLGSHGIERGDIACVCVGRGPGSFTGVRIAMATAKGIASALEVPLVGVSSLDAVAWVAWEGGVRGELAVVADAMRREVYPVRYEASDEGVRRLEADRVVKAQAAADELAARVGSGSGSAVGSGAGSGSDAGSDAAAGSGAAPSVASCPSPASGSDALFITGDGLKKYAELFAPHATLLPEKMWAPTGRGLLLALQAAWRAGDADPLDVVRHDPGKLLPVYTRLSDAEENERIRLAKNDPKNLETGVQDSEALLRRDQRTTMHDTAVLNARPDAQGITYKPLDAAHAAAVAAMESQVMGSDAWNERQVADELPRRDRVWWAAYAASVAESESNEHGGEAFAAGAVGDASREVACGSAAAPSSSERSSQVLIGYAGGWIVDGDVQILKVGVDPAFRRRGIACELLARVAADARDLGAETCSLEVRVGNGGAQALYRSLGMASIGVRPRYYSDREDAVIMEGPITGLLGQAHVARGNAGAACGVGVDSSVGVSSAGVDVAGMHLHVDEAHDSQLQSVVGAGARMVPDAGVSADRGRSEAPSGSVVEEVARDDRPLILAIESSCDETAAAIVDGSGALLSDVVASQIDFHARFGGVVPEIASRKHIEAVCGVCDECLEVAAARLGRSRLSWRDLDAVAVTYAPGLVGALVVGVAFTKGAAWAADKPFIGVNHLEGHLYANKIGAPDFAPPAVVSLVSGGNTMLVHMRGWGEYRVLGATIDDAVGEAFDKVAKALGLGYPGGPVVSAQAASGRADAIPFPRAMMHSGDLRFSLSGLKTAVVTYINNERAAGHDLNVPDICASFQQAVVDVQVKKAEMALRETGAPTFCLGGGVAANPVLRAAYEKLCERLGVRLVMPPLSACGDNAGMIALVALDRYRAGRFFSLDTDAYAHADLEKPY